MGFHDHFSGVATGYAQHRPRYPHALVAALAEASPGRARALDVGCGNGQLAVALAGLFSEVIAVDASAAQVASAEAHPRVTYGVAPAEATGVAPHSVDLLTAAQAAHWFDLPAFYAEVVRVVRPGGIVALVSYGFATLEGAPGEVLAAFGRDVAEPWWPPERVLVEEGYRSLPFPFAPVELAPIPMVEAWSLDRLLGYVGTWSALSALRRAHPARDPVAELAGALGPVWGPPDQAHEVAWPLAVRVGRVA